MHKKSQSYQIFLFLIYFSMTYIQLLPEISQFKEYNLEQIFIQSTMKNTNIKRLIKGVKKLDLFEKPV